ncbi:MAG: hypothetical protein H0U79_06260, partial [Solirubrobacterales bacterium]|nr:hypothetical protein [Solirubrobacterales bacterium]
MRFLFTTIQFTEADFYARVSEHLRDGHGHEVAHVVVSRRATEAMRARGLDARCLPDLMASAAPLDLAAETERLEASYDTPSLRDVWLTDPACAGRPEAWCLERTVRCFRALERAFDDVGP